MKKISLIILVILAVFALSQVATADRDADRNKATVDFQKRMVIIPPRAVEVAPGVFSLGKGKDKSGLEVEGYAIVHYKDTEAKFGKGIITRTPSCYGFLSGGAKWKWTEPYVLDTTNADGMTDEFLVSVTLNSLEKWDSQVSFDIFGSRDSSQTVDGVDLNAPDDKNEIYFGAIDSPNAIAMTVVWGIFSGPTSKRKLVEYDVVFDDQDYVWDNADTKGLGVMDYENIATHEFGHSAGMNDVYQSACKEVTMYGYSDYGEIKKRTLEQADINGIRKLY